MGSLASRPKVPGVQQPQVIYVPAPVQTTSSPAATTNVAPQPSGQKEDSSAAVREQNLLTRNRGRFGTVTTSFRGLLSAVGNGRQTKTLLGE